VSQLCRGLLAAASIGSTLACGAVDVSPLLDTSRAVVDAAGRPLAVRVAWRVDVGSPNVLEEGSPQTGGLALSDDGTRLFAALASGSVSAFDALTGERIWSTPFGGALTGAPTFVDNIVYVGAPDGTLRALDAGGGSELWRFTAPCSFGAAPVVVDDVVYAVGSNSKLYAVSRSTGAAIWTFERPPARGIEMVGQSGVYVGESLVCAGFSDGSVGCADRVTGTTAWVADLTHGQRRLVDVDSTPVVSQGNLVAASFSGGISGLDAATGVDSWHYEIQGATSLVEVDGHIVTSTADGSLLWFDAADGTVLMSLALESNGLTPVVATDEFLVVAGARGGVFFVATDAPWILNRFDPDSPISATPAVHGSAAYVVSDGGYLYRIDISQL
jgi:outer membrane protein assembly factor BamB